MSNTLLPEGFPSAGILILGYHQHPHHPRHLLHHHRHHPRYLHHRLRYPLPHFLRHQDHHQDHLHRHLLLHNQCNIFNIN